MRHEKFRATLGSISERALIAVDTVAPLYS